MKKMQLKEILYCFGGKGECQCSGTDDPAEQLFGSFKKITANEQECIDWCLNVKRGGSWKFIDNGTFDLNILHYFGIGGGEWHVFKKDV